MTRNGLRNAARQGVKAIPGGPALVANVVLARHVPAILRSGIFDVEYYEAQRGRTFDGPRAAILDYLTQGRREGLSPHPLFEPEWVLPEDWRHRESLIVWLRRRHSRRRIDPGPLFSTGTYLSDHPEASGHPGGALGHFLATAGPDTPLPVPASVPGPAPTWGEVRERLMERARFHGRWGAAKVGRRTGTWDDAADARFVSLWGAAPLPEADDAAPIVSVVMPVRNRPELVGLAIASVRAQTLEAWELIVVDDGSTDDTADVVAALAALDPRVRLVRREQGGVCAARNTGIAQARGRYVAFLDSDNQWVPHFLRTMLAWMHGSDVAVGYCVVDSGRSGGDRYLAHDGGLDDLSLRNHIDLNALVARTDLVRRIGGFDESLRRWVDHDLALRLAVHARPQLAPFVGVRYDDSEDAADRITRTESDHWQWVVLAKRWVDWAGAEATLAERVPGRVSISMPTYQDWALTIRAVRAVLDNSGDIDVEVVVLDNGSRRSVPGILTAAFATEPRVKIVAMPMNLNFAAGSNIGFVASTGEVVVFLNNDTEVSPGWLAPLVSALDDPGVLGSQPLLLYPDGTIQSAGTVFPDVAKLPTPFLVNQPPEDAERAAPIRLRVVTAAALAMRAVDVVRLRGFDPIFVNGMEDVDLCLRAWEESKHSPVGEGRFAVVTESRVMHHESKTPGRGRRIQPNRALLLQRWAGKLPPSDTPAFAALGLHVAHLDQGPPARDPGEVRIPRPILVRPPRLVPSGPAKGAPSLRWAIKIASPAGVYGDGWGDTHFALALRMALERLGQEVVVDRLESHERPTSYLDDVVLTLRGLQSVTPQPGRINLLWVISHPEVVTPEEVRSYDAAFAASEPWAAAMSRQAGVPVRPLLQATDPSVFHPEADAPAHVHSALFVGNSRNVYRPIVRDAIEAGLDVSIYGAGWEDTPAADFVAGEYLPNDQLAAWYARARLVLCDHWAEMAQEGFISNRVFDALATGARLVSDRALGLDELFGDAVAIYDTPDDLRRFVDLDESELDVIFGDDVTRRDVAKRVLDEHSFDARARQLLQAALQAREVAAERLA